MRRPSEPRPEPQTDLNVYEINNGNEVTLRY